MSHKIGAIYHILLWSHYGIWTINPIKGHVVLQDRDLGIETPLTLLEHNDSRIYAACIVCVGANLSPYFTRLRLLYYAYTLLYSRLAYIYFRNCSRKAFLYSALLYFTAFYLAPYMLAIPYDTLSDRHSVCMIQALQPWFAS